MSEIIRDTFIALHSSDVLGKLQTEVRCASLLFFTFSHKDWDIIVP